MRDRPSLPDVSLWPRLIAPSFPIAIVSYTTTLSLGQHSNRISLTRLGTFLGKKFADFNDYTIDAEQEAYSIGLGNVFGKWVSDFIYLRNIYTHTLTVC